jgi:hypothetical protein
MNTAEYQQELKEIINGVQKRPDLVQQPTKLAASEMEKGAARRIYGGIDSSKLPGRNAVAEWQESLDSLKGIDYNYNQQRHQAARREIPKMEDGLRVRALNKLSNRTLTRKHPETGKTQYLLFRGIGPKEKQSVLGNSFVRHDDYSSWTPHLRTAKYFETDYSSYGPAQTIAAWIDEDKIHAAPHMYGYLPGPEKDKHKGSGLYVPENETRGKNIHTSEHEIIVAPHSSDLATQDDIKRYQAIHNPDKSTISQSDPKKDIHSRINYRDQQVKSGFSSTNTNPLIGETRPIILSAIPKKKKKIW